MGNCNPIELHNIIETIRPEIIFEELSQALFDESYVQGKLITLETSAIKKYLQNHTVRYIPVDTYPLPVSYYDDLVPYRVNPSQRFRPTIINEKPANLVWWRI